MNAAIRGEPSEVYHATDAISHSKLEVFRRRPALYHRKYVLKVVPDADSSAFAIGRATHAAVLEPQTYGTLYAVHLTPQGAGYEARLEEFITASPVVATVMLVTASPLGM